MMRKEVGANSNLTRESKMLMDNAIHVTNSRKSLGTGNDFTNINDSKDTQKSLKK